MGLWFVFFLGLCLLTAGLWSGWQDYTQASKNQGPELAQRVVPAGLAHASVDQSAANPGLIEIRKIQPGMRVEAFNPEVSDEERESWPTIDHKRWFALSVLLIGSEGEPVYLELIRPVEWVLALDAQEGHEVWLDLPELNSKGWGRVTKLRRSQPFEDGPGRVVTGTFTRQVQNVVNLHVEGLKAPIGVTQNHPIWSEDRQAFVQAGSLQAGERLRSMIGGEGGGIAHVTAITPRGPPGHRETVFNLEVEGEHAYQVSGLGLVVHNTYPKGVGNFKPNGGHHIHAKASFRGHPKYDKDTALSISYVEMAIRGWIHGQMTGMQHRLYSKLAKDLIKNPKLNLRRANNKISVMALMAGGATYKEARDLVALSLRKLRSEEKKRGQAPFS